MTANCPRTIVLSTLLLVRLALSTPVQAAEPPSAGLQLWLDASDSATLVRGADGRIAAWRDKSGCGHDAVNRVPASNPRVIAGAMAGRDVLVAPGNAAFADPCEPSGSRLIPQVQGGKRFDRMDWREEKTVTLANYPRYEPGEPTALSKYGGRMDRDRQPATGFFHVKKVNGRWWWIDPDGCLFYGTGTTHTGRQIDQPPYAAFFTQKYGTVEQFVQDISTLYDCLGINCVGEEGLTFFAAHSRPRPYFMYSGFMTEYYATRWRMSYTTGRAKFGNAYMAAAATADFAAFARRLAQKTCRPNDPYLMGYWTENELPFITINTPLLTEYLSYTEPDTDFAKVVALAWLSERRAAPKPPFPESLEMEFRMYLVAAYHRVCYEALKQADPNHLCCGYRMNNGWGKNQVLYRDENFWRTIAPWVDVQCVNLYNTWTPDPALLSQWQRLLGDKPFFITEWYAKGADSAHALAKYVKAPDTPINKSGAGFLVPTQQDRADFYENFALALLRHSGCVGWHYFRWQDDVFNDAANKGFLTVEYEPYPELCESIRRINSQRYRLVDFFDRR